MDAIIPPHPGTWVIMYNIYYILAMLLSIRINLFKSFFVFKILVKYFLFVFLL